MSLKKILASKKKSKNKIRLTDQELGSIKALFQQFFTSTDHLWIFGTRINPERQDGNIDLYIETEETDYDTVFRQKSDFTTALHDTFGEQKIDVVVKLNQEDVADLPIYTVAKETGILLL